MAHVIGKQPTAARSDVSVGTNDTHENLILLCPDHHTLIDKGSADFPRELLLQWKSKWEEKVKQKFQSRMSSDVGDELEMRLWSYFNFDMILRLIESSCPQKLVVPPVLQNQLMIDRAGFPLENEMKSDARTVFASWPMGGRYLQQHYSSLVESILKDSHPIDLDEFWGIKKLEGLLYPNALVFTNRRSIFATIDKNEKPERRTVRCFARNVELIYQINTWNIFSDSSLDLHFRGSSKIASLLVIRSLSRELKKGKPTLVLKATPVALGTGFWSPHDRTPSVACDIPDNEND
jgi:hypothetical protein